MKFDKIEKLDDERFRRLTGVKRNTFDKMVQILQQADAAKKSKGGRKYKLRLEDMLLMTLEYMREYRTYFHISQSYGISESSAYKAVKWIEDTLIKHPDFALPGRKELLKSDTEYEVILVDATETPIERPKKKQKRYYSGKKKKHTLKTQVVVDKKSKKVICTSYGNGKKHDFRLFKESQVKINPQIRVLTDSGYQGLRKLHAHTQMPKKKSKKKPLTKEDKRTNQSLSRERVANENVIGLLKRFKIIADRYRNRRKRFALRFNLIAAIYNWELNT
ncbi:IS5 family transposase [Neochlamydia sp. AcF84]|uniref:IS5 family transposase n=2 Tax=unclassified Neochlamydia TaxID=2643326 RepID=UPI001F62035D|nr:IS5 family transposase [Neochlamydia sp. AcF84]